ncbi:MvdC/MvdD family ATP grasp protein [Amycolatopsis sp. NPDC004079]|uniref:MvdC/MvdD family ATP grasp protein n=1 Tax=Amycolatopsis sp. NPDC004079 TaxID=3154549 RepID=UPI0033A3D6C3
MTVLVLARDFDPTADAVVTALADRGVPVFRTDLAAFPSRLRMNARLRSGRWTGRLWNDHHEVRLEDVRSIWNRGPRTYHFDDALPPALREFCYREAKLGVGGVLAALDALYANHPNRCADAIFKPYQWKIAAECGLAVADTAITNDVDAARWFIGDRPRDSITKALGPTGIIVDGEARVSHTRPLSDEDLADLDAVAMTATTVQRWVPKAFEVRLTVVGAELFGVAIHADSEDARIDWRSDPAALRHELIDVPGPVAEGVARYMRRTSLAYAGFDFAVTPSGRWTMLEANTGPQVGWLQAATGAPITDALADLLAKGAT